MLGTWFADGDLWFSLGTAVEVGGQDQAGILYGAIEPSFKKGKLKGKVEVQQYLAVEGNNLIMPSVGVDANGHGYLAFTLVGPDHFPSAAVAKISLDRSASKVRIVEAGLGPQDGFSGYWIGGSRPRWGDYSYVAVDEDRATSGRVSSTSLRRARSESGSAGTSAAEAPEVHSRTSRPRIMELKEVPREPRHESSCLGPVR